MKRTYRTAVMIIAAVVIVSVFFASGGQGGRNNPASQRLPGARSVIDAGRYATIQAAIDALPEEGGVVRLPPGTFEISSPLKITKSDVLFEGADTATHIKNINAEGKSALILQHPSGVDSRKAELYRIRLANFRITGNEKSGHGIEARRINEIFIDGVTVSYHGGDGIQLYHCFEDPRICDSMITYNKKTGLNVIGGHDVVVSANQFEENHDGVRFIDGFNLCMTGNNLDDHLGHGVVIENTGASVISGNMIEECAETPIVLDRNCYGIAFSANVIAHNSSGGIDLRDAHGCAVSANTFTISGPDDLSIGPNSFRITVTGNIFSNSYLGDGKIFDKAGGLQEMLAQVEATHLHQAAAEGKIEQVKLLISEGDDVNEKTTTGDTPLHYAVRYGHEDAAKLLIAKSAHVNERTAEGDTPLHYAAKYGHKNMAVLLIKKGADVNAKNKNGDLPTHLALRGHLESPKKEVLDLLIAKGPKLSCIQISAYQGDLAKVRSFVEQGIDVDSRDSEGRTALYYAAIQGKRDVVEFLLSRSANVNAKDKDYGFMPLHHAVGGGHKDVVELLIAKGADVNAKDKYGWTPLDSSVYGGNMDIPELLIEAGANVNSRYGWGQTPLIWAAQEGHTPVVQLLIVKGADVNAQDDQGLTPLHYAADEGHKDVAELLIAKGADVNAKNQQTESPLSMAKAKGRKELVELLRKHGAKE